MTGCKWGAAVSEGRGVDRSEERETGRVERKGTRSRGSKRKLVDITCEKTAIIFNTNHRLLFLIIILLHIAINRKRNR